MIVQTLFELNRSFIRNWGGSLVVTIPVSVRRALSLDAGREVRILRGAESDDLVIRFSDPSAPAGEVSVTPERAAKKLSTKGKKGKGGR